MEKFPRAFIAPPHPSPTISSVKSRRFKRVLTRQPQVDETNEREFAIGGGQPGIPYETPRSRLVDREIMSDGWLVTFRTAALLVSFADKTVNPLLLLRSVWDLASTGSGDRPKRRVRCPSQSSKHQGGHH